MRIHYGCELSIVVDWRTAATCLVDIHPGCRHNIISEDVGDSSSRLPFVVEADVFGNLMRRFIVQEGESTIALDGIIEDAGVPDPRDAFAIGLPVAELPSGVLTYLNGSRYCETDKLGAIAWQTFGHLQPGTAMVEAICTFTHERLTFDYQQARSTRTALEAYQERVGVCRDFTHLAITLCRCMNVPVRYVNGYLGDIGVPPDPAPMDL